MEIHEEKKVPRKNLWQMFSLSETWLFSKELSKQKKERKSSCFTLCTLFLSLVIQILSQSSPLKIQTLETILSIIYSDSEAEDYPPPDLEDASDLESEPPHTKIAEIKEKSVALP